MSVKPSVCGVVAFAADPDTPWLVHHVELAKSYGATDGYKFVNAVLDKLAAAVRSPEVSAARA